MKEVIKSILLAIIIVVIVYFIIAVPIVLYYNVNVIASLFCIAVYGITLLAFIIYNDIK